MRCAKCQHENPEGVSFCEECANPLGRACPSCGATASPRAKFCGKCATPLDAAEHTARDHADRSLLSYTPKHLAEKILSLRGALEGERKQVTVLFADVKGSMELASQVDAEQWHTILDRFFQILADGVHRFEGTVNQYTGDGIMALFGAPIAHEDHAQRACYAALSLRDELRRYAHELRRAHGLDFQVRMGLNSGDVVVGKIGDDLRMDYTAQGQTVGLAQRMEQLAEAGRIYVAEATAGLVRGYLALEDLGEFQVKGRSAPLRVHSLDGVGAAHTRLDLSRARGFSRFVGRAAEMATLEATLARTLEGEGQVIGIVGEAGVGKSRLCHEFLERCRARGIATYEAHGVAHGKAVPLLPILQLFRNFYGITDADRPAIAREKIAGRLLLLDRGFDEVLPVLFDFLGVPDPERPAPLLDATIRQHQLFELSRRLIQVRGQKEPTVGLLEDLHWFDAGSEAFLGPMVAALAGTRTLLLMNFRPEYRAPWMQRSDYQQVALRPLGPEDAKELLRSLLGAHPSLGALNAAIRERTAGNPFFIEEVVRSLEETGCFAGARGEYRLVQPVDAVAVPATVQAVLAARIDRLAEAEKEALQTAAVIGRDFRETLLVRVLDWSPDELSSALSTLVAAEFLHESALYPEREYVFSHPLTREVAYGSQLADRRLRMHAATARALEEGEAERLDERAAVLAYHWESACDWLAAARWHRRAAEWAYRTDLAEAKRHWMQVRTLAHRLPPSTEQATLGATAGARLLFLAGWLAIDTDEGAALYEEATKWAGATGDARLQLAVLVGYAPFRCTFQGDPLGCVELLSEALRQTSGSGPPEAELVIHTVTASVLHSAGSYREMLAEAEAALRLAGDDTRVGADLLGFSPAIAALAMRGVAKSELGDIAAGERFAEQAIALAASEPVSPVLGSSNTYASRVAWLRGDAALCMRRALDALEVSGKLGLSSLEIWGHVALGLAHVLSERWDDAVLALERSVDLTRRYRVFGWEGVVLDRLATAHLGAGNAEMARTLAEEAIDLAARQGTIGFGYCVHLTLARALLHTAGASRGAIETALAEAQALITRTEARSEQPRIHLVRAELAAVLGDEARRRQELSEAHRLFVETGATGWAERAAKELRA
jgi:class 3 adenylate cyclase